MNMEYIIITDKIFRIDVNTALRASKNVVVAE